MTKTLIVPGLDGSDAPHWQHWWAATDSDAVTVPLPDVARPVPAEWEATLAAMIRRHPDSILVGHSLGAVLIAQLLAKRPRLRVRAALLVAPAEPQCSQRTAQFGRLPEVSLGVPTTVVASRNDPWMSFAGASTLARGWGGQLVDLGWAGHVNAEAGFGPWQGGKELRDALARRTDTPVADRGWFARFLPERRGFDGALAILGGRS